MIVQDDRVGGGGTPASALVRRRDLAVAAAAALALAAAVQPLVAQTAQPGGSGPASPAAPDQDPRSAALRSTLTTQEDARTIFQAIPAPRGQITDRNGIPLAQNRIGYYLAIDFPYFEDASDEAVLRFALEQTSRANRAMGTDWSIPEERVLEHYQHRRWLPLHFKWLLDESQVTAIEPLTRAGRGLLLQPCYVRVYPEGAFAPHVLGYIGATLPDMPSGPIGGGDPLWMPVEGKAGLEAHFDQALSGQDGTINLLFDGDGQKLPESIVSVPRPGHNVVTALDADVQRYAENALQEHVKRGAMVVMEIATGDVLALASWPLFDPNVWVPRISTDDYAKLREDPEIPLFGRAFQGLYPPASTFKVPVALAALESGTIGEWDEYNGPPSLRVGDRVMRNWNKDHEGSLNVVGALRRSCNTWFYQVGRKTTAEPFLSLARRLGFGSKTGIPIAGEASGTIPAEATYSVTVANLSIGQGALNATPLQVARAMAAVGDGSEVRVPRLVLQIQDLNNQIVEAFPVLSRNGLNVSKANLDIVRKGMWEVVNAGGGTGRRASIEFCEVAGKTGTGEWRVDGQDRRVAWFAGYLPADDPKYSFAVLYEGGPGETVSGGRLAAPIVHDVFTNFYANDIDDRIERRLQKNLEEEGEGDPDTLADAGESGEGEGGAAAEESPAPPRPAKPPRALPVEQPQVISHGGGAAPPAEPEEEEPRGLLRGLWRKIRGR